MGIEEKTKGALGTEAGAELVPVRDAKTSAGQQTLVNIFKKYINF